MEFKFILTYNSTPTVVEEPVGFDDISFNIIRHEHHGFNNTTVLNLSWYGEAYNMIESVYQSDGIDAEIYLDIMYRRDLAQNWETLMEGRLNLIDLNCDHSKNLVSCTIEQDSPYYKLISNKKKDIDLLSNQTLDGNTRLSTNNSIVTTMPNIPLFRKSKGVDVGNYSLTDAGTSGHSNQPFTRTQTCVIDIVPLLKIEDEVLGFNSGIPYFTLFSGYTNIPDGINSYLECQEKGIYDYEINGTLKVKMSVEDGNINSIDYFKLLTDARDPSGIAYYSLQEDYSGDNFVILSNTLTITRNGINMNLGDQLKLFHKANYQVVFNRSPFSNNPFAIKLEVIDSSFQIKINSFTRIDDTVARALYAYESLNTTLEAITENTLQVKSDYLGRSDVDTDLSSIPYSPSVTGFAASSLITSGFCLRGWNDYDGIYKSVFTNFDKLFTNLSKIFALGYTLEYWQSKYWLRIEPVSFFYKNDVILTIENINPLPSTLISNVDPSHYYTEIEVGYNKWDNEHITNLNEIHASRKLVTKNQQEQKSLDLKSDIIASGVTLEMVRRIRRVKASTTDTSYDDDLFIVRTIRPGDEGYSEEDIYAVKKGVYNASNLDVPEEQINADISPIDIANRWKFLIATPSRNNDIARFSSGTGNYEAEYSQTDVPIEIYTQNGDLTQNDAIFEAETLGLKYGISIEEFKNIMQNPFGTIVVNGVNYYLQKLEFKIKEPSRFKLIKAYEHI